jgi:hypothetical protein
MYDEDTCKETESVWAVCGKGEHGLELWFFEAHLSDDEYSPVGWSWTFASFAKDADGGWSDYDGGQYWGFANSSELDEVIGDTLPFREYTYKPIDHADFDAICFEGDSAKEREYAAALGIKAPGHDRKEKSYSVTITETLKRTVSVKANSVEEAQTRVEDGWKNELHVLGAEDFKEVHFTLAERQQERGRPESKTNRGSGAR